ncbi:MAG: beta strand repeat-containing protein, partial [Planctomycetaceae bacterium]
SNGLLFGENTTNNTNLTLTASLTNLTISGKFVRLGVSNGRSINFTSQFRGAGGSFTVNNLSMTGNTVYGTPASGSQAVFMSQYGAQRRTGVTVSSNTFHGSVSMSGVSNATISDNSFKRVYLGLTNSTISNNTFTSNGYYGLSLVGTADNNPTPSADVTLSGNTFTYNAVAAPSGAVSDVGLSVATGTSASTITLAGNTFVNGGVSSTLPVAAIAQRSGGTTLNAVNATPNVFNGISLTDSTTTADLFSIADQVADSVDASNLGTVALRTGYVYVTANSFWSPTPSSTTTPDVQRGVSTATAGDTVLVGPGTYSGALLIDKSLTVKSSGGAASTTIQGASTDVNGPYAVRMAADNVRVEGFTISNLNAANGRAIAPSGQSGGQIVDNIFVNSFRGVQGDYYGRPTNLTVTGNTFESTISLGIAGTEDVSFAALSGNTFKTSVEGIGLGDGVSIADNALTTTDDFLDLISVQNNFNDSDTGNSLLTGGYAVKDYRTPSTVYVNVGGSLDNAVDGAEPGDNVVFWPGLYTGNVSVEQAVTLRPVGPSQVEIVGDLTFSGSAGATINLGVDSPYAGRTESFLHATGNIDLAGATVSVTGGGAAATPTERIALITAGGTISGTGTLNGSSVTLGDNSFNYDVSASEIALRVGTTISVTADDMSYDTEAYDLATFSITPSGGTATSDPLDSVSLVATYFVSDGSGGWTTLAGAPTNTGSYKVVVTYAGSTNYAAASAEDTFAITAQVLTVTATATSRVYNGTDVATVTLDDDRVAGDELTISYTSATFDTKNVGNGKTVTVTGLSLSGPDSGNYILAETEITTTADITAKSITGQFTAESRTYDATTDATVDSRTLTGVETDD